MTLALPADCFRDCLSCFSSAVDGCSSCKEGLILVDSICRSCDYFLGLTMTEDNVCIEECGDGVFLGLTSECDDGNLFGGDGCSEKCTVEYGFACEGGTVCREIIPPTLTLTTVEKPNVIVLEFDEDVFVGNASAFSSENLNLNVQGLSVNHYV